MKNVIKFLMMVSLLCTICTACSKGETTVEKKNDGKSAEKKSDGKQAEKKVEHKSTYSETIDALDPETVLIVVNGRKATKRDLTSILSFRDAFYKFMQKDIKEGDLEKVGQTAVSTFSGNFIRETLFQNAIDAYLNEHGPFSTNQMAIARKAVERQYENSRASGRVRFAAIQKQMQADGVGDFFSRTIELETLQEAFLANAFTNRFVIDSNTIARVYASVAEHNQIVAATNRAIAAQMQEVLKKLDNGEPFEILANQYSMDEQRNPGGDMGECLDRDFADAPQVWEAIQKLAVGRHTGVIELDDSFQIFKLIEKVPAIKSVSREDALHLARIYFRRADPIEKYSEEQVRATLEKDRRKRLTTEVIEKGLLTIKVEFPNGDLLPRESADFYLDRAKELQEEAADKAAEKKETVK